MLFPIEAFVFGVIVTVVVPTFIAVTFVPAAIPVVVEITIPTTKLVTLASLIVGEPDAVFPPVVLLVKEQIEVVGVATNAAAAVAADVAPATAP